MPKWVAAPEKLYPQSEFICAIGDGNSIEVAQSAAVASISMLFQTKTGVRSTAVKEMTYIQEENKNEYISSQSAVQVINIQSDADFLCTKFDEPYFDKKQNKYFVLAYINRKEAETVYRERVNHLMALVRKLSSVADSDTELFRAVSNYQKALAVGQLAESYIQNAVIINPANADSFADDLRMIESVQGKLLDKKEFMTFSVSCNDERCRRIENHVISLLEEKGFTYTEKNALYNIDMNFDFVEESYSAGEFVRPNARIQIKNGAGKTIKSYSKSYTRYGAKTLETAYTRTFLKIQEDLSENFLSEFQ